MKAGFFAGTKQAVQIISKNYYSLHDELLKRGHFVGKEQNLMNILTFDEITKKDVTRLRTFELSCNQKYDPWLFYQYFFANDSEYICSEDRLSLVM